MVSLVGLGGPQHRRGFGSCRSFFESSLCVRKSMLGHIFRTEAKHSGPRKKDGERKSRELARRVEDLNGRGPAMFMRREGSRLSRRRDSCARSPPRVGTNLAKPDTLQEWF